MSDVVTVVCCCCCFFFFCGAGMNAEPHTYQASTPPRGLITSTPVTINWGKSTDIILTMSYF